MDTTSIFSPDNQIERLTFDSLSQTPSENLCYPDSSKITLPFLLSSLNFALLCIVNSFAFLIMSIVSSIFKTIFITPIKLLSLSSHLIATAVE